VRAERAVQIWQQKRYTGLNWNSMTSITLCIHSAGGRGGEGGWQLAVAALGISSFLNADRLQITNRQKFVSLSSLVEGLN